MSLLSPEAQAVVDEIADGLDERKLDVGELLGRVTAHLHAEAMSVFVLDRAAEELVLRYACGPASEQVVGLRIPVGQGVVGWVVQYNEDLIVPETVRDPRFYGGVDKETGFVTRSILCVPMLQAGQVIGAVETMNKRTGHFNDEDVLFLQEIADVIADYA